MTTSQPTNAGRRQLTPNEQHLNDFLMNNLPESFPQIPPLKRFAADRTDYSREITLLYQQQFDLNNSKAVDEYFDIIRPEPDNKVFVIEGALWKQRGTNLFKAGRYKEAREAYLKAIESSLAHRGKRAFPSQTAFVDTLVDANIEQFGDAFTSASNVAQCYIKENNILQVINTLLLTNGY